MPLALCCRHIRGHSFDGRISPYLSVWPVKYSLNFMAEVVHYTHLKAFKRATSTPAEYAHEKVRYISTIIAKYVGIPSLLQRSNAGSASTEMRVQTCGTPSTTRISLVCRDPRRKWRASTLALACRYAGETVSES